MQAKTPWVDFRSLREQLKFMDVLNYHGVTLKIRGDQASGFCPLPDHPARSNGSKRTPSFSANLTKGIWQCFGGCKSSGNVLDFTCRMQGLDPSNMQDIRTAAVKIAAEFGIICTKPERSDALSARTRVRPAKAAKTRSPAVLPDAAEELAPENLFANAPLDFELKMLNPDHPYLLSRGFLPATINHFGLGFCSRGMLKDRVAIPLRDDAGVLIGYSGRLIDDALVDEDHPKYRFPGRRKLADMTVEFRKSLFLYNGHAIQTPVRDLIVVEGFASVWWLWQHGYKNIVSLMGSSVSEEQADLLEHKLQPDGCLWIITDGDDPGENCAHDLFARIGPQHFVRWMTLTTEQQPTDLSAAELASHLGHLL